MLFCEAEFYSPKSKHVILYPFRKTYGSVAGVRKLNPKVLKWLLHLLGLRLLFPDDNPLFGYNLCITPISPTL